MRAVRRGLTLALLGVFVLLLGAAPPARAALEPIQADRILVLKSRHMLLLMRDGFVFKRFPIALGFNPIGAKSRAGDGKTPEGVYVIDGRNPDSHYFLSLHISYPTAAEAQTAALWRTDPGGAIFIHGLPPAFAGYNPARFEKDWTDGCISVSDKAVAEIWQSVPDGTPIEIRP